MGERVKNSNSFKCEHTLNSRYCAVRNSPLILVILVLVGCMYSIATGVHQAVLLLVGHNSISHNGLHDFARGIESSEILLV